jgi:hypothetical protein
MVRTGVAAWTLALFVLAGAALAQSGEHVFNVGERTVGAVHPLELTAHNENCRQGLDFRFNFAPSPWLRPQGSTLVRGVPAGESRQLPALIDLTQMQPGHYTADVEVVCENCTFLIVRTCQFDRQHLTSAVDAVTPPASAAAAAPAIAQAPTRRTTAPSVAPAPAPDTPQQAPANEAQPSPQPTESQEPVQAVASPASPTPPGARGDCTGALVALAALAAAALAAALGCGLWASNAARMAKHALSDAEARGLDLQQRLEEIEALCDRSRKELEALMQAQFQAMRALKALSMTGQLSGESAAWTRICVDAGYGIDAGMSGVARRRSDATLQQAMEAVTAPSQTFSPLSADPSAAPAGHRQRLDWLHRQGFARDDEAAQAVLGEMANYMAYGHSMSDMNERLRAQAEECRRADMERASLLAQAAGG